MTHQLLEVSQTGAVETGSADSKTGRIKVGLITPGWGSSGYYSETVLRNAVEAKVFPAGTKMFLDHPSESERKDRPERSVRDLAAVLVEDARWEDGQIVGETQVFGPYIDLLTDRNFAKTIGVSIRAYGDATIGEAEGRKGHLITQLTESESVDFVTAAGRGGSILEVYESARPAIVEERAVARGIEEASVNTIREALSSALRPLYSEDDTWVSVLDFDESKVWFAVEGPSVSGTYQHNYAFSGTKATLAEGDPTPVQRVITYVPISADATLGAVESEELPIDPVEEATTPTSEEDTMEIEESRLATLEEAAGRVPTLESERDVAVRRAEEAELRLAESVRRVEAERIISARASEAAVTFTPLEQRGLLAELPVTESGELDVEAFTTSVDEAAAARSEANGSGRVTGFGSTDPVGDQPTINVEAEVASAFGRQVKEATA